MTRRSTSARLSPSRQLSAAHQLAKLFSARSKPSVWVIVSLPLMLTDPSSTIRPTRAGYSSAYSAPIRVPYDEPK